MPSMMTYFSRCLLSVLPYCNALISTSLFLLILPTVMVFGSRDYHTSSSSRVTRPSVASVASEGHHRLIRQFLPRGLTGTVRCPARADPPHRMIVWMKDDQVLTFERQRTRQENGVDRESDDDVLVDDEYDNEENIDDSWLDEDGEDDEEEKEHDDDDDDDSTLEERMTIDMYGLLTIEDVTWSDAGVYKCTLYSPVDGNGDTHIISVLVRDPAAFTTRPSTIYQRLLGHSVTMSCVADGDPRPEIHWIKANGNFPSTTRTLQEEGNLTIVHLNYDDQGLYECTASNIVANTITTALLIIHANSFISPYNVTVETTATTATVSWLPGFSAHRHHHCVLWFKKQGGKHARWHTLSISSDDVTSVVVHALQPDTTYRFMMMSRDDENEAHFSDVVLARTQGYVALPVKDEELSPDDDDDDDLVLTTRRPWTTFLSSSSLRLTQTTLTSITHLQHSQHQHQQQHSTPLASFEPVSAPPTTASHISRYSPPPRPPIDIRVSHYVSANEISEGAVLISWQAPPEQQQQQPSLFDSDDGALTRRPAVDHYVVEYRTESDWIPITRDLINVTVGNDDDVNDSSEKTLNETRPPTLSSSFLWTSALPGVVYQFRVFSVSKASVMSEPSDTVILHTADSLVKEPASNSSSSNFIISVIGILIFCILTVTLLAIGVKLYSDKRCRPKHRDDALTSPSAAVMRSNNHFSYHQGHATMTTAAAAAGPNNAARFAIETPI